jgi:hypothetical protein
MLRSPITRGAALFALALSGSSLSAFGQDLKQTPGSNVRVMQCLPHLHTAGTAHPWIDPYGVWHSSSDFPYSQGFLAITYVNDAKKPATEVDFGLVSRGTLIAVTNDVGSFATGASIAHEFSVSPQIFPIGTALPYCAVLRVKYADGTEWHNPSPPQE